MKFRFLIGLFVVFALLALLVSPAHAGHYKLVYEEKGQVSVELFDDKGQQKILFRVLPLTGDRTAGPCVLRFDGVYVGEKVAPAYEWEFSLNEACIPSLKGNPDKGGELCIPWLKGDPTQKVDLRRLTIGIHTVEAYFASKDGNGHLDRNRTAAPATQFRIEETAPPAAATTNQGQPLTPDQFKDAISQSYDQGVQAGKAAAAKEREQLMLELQKATDENNELRRKVVEKPTTPAQPGPKLYIPRYIPVTWKLADWPKLGDQMILTRDGKVVTEAKNGRVVEIFPTASRLWVVFDLPADFDIAGCKIERRVVNRQDGEYRNGEK